MSRIDELIAEHCPNGVEFKELQELFITRNGYTPSTTNKAFWTDGTVPWFRMEDIRENGRILGASMQQITEEAVKGNRLFPANSIIIATSATIGEHALITVPHLSNQRFTSLALKPDFIERLDIKFVFYYCFVLDDWCRKNTTTSSFASVDMNGFKKFCFPLPHIEVQREIVKVLDTFTKLEAELEARRRQYQYYRDALLGFEGDGSFSPLSQCCESIADGDHQAPQKTETGIPFITISDVSETNQIDFRDTKFISESYYEKLDSKRKAKTNDILYTVVGSFGIPIHIENDKKFAFQRHIAILRPNPKVTISKYMYHALRSSTVIKQANNAATGAAQKTITLAALNRIHIPVPPLEEQARIVAILDKFDVLVNDLSSGLPAEIVFRQKQYRHYRDRLLTFREAA